MGLHRAFARVSHHHKRTLANETPSPPCFHSSSRERWADHMAAAMCVSILVYVLFLHAVARHRDGWAAPLARRGSRLAWYRFCGEMEMGKIPPQRPWPKCPGYHGRIFRLAGRKEGPVVSDNYAIGQLGQGELAA